MSTIVRTQQELDEALAARAEDIVIDSPAGVWLGVAGSVSVRVVGSAKVRASGSATVEAWDAATVLASGWATVWASGSATVWATGSVTVWAWGSAIVRAGSHVAVHLYSRSATVHGGVVIDHTAMDLTDPAQWCDYYGVAVVDGTAVVVKYVGPDLTSHHGTVYPVGETVTAPDYNGRPECGGGLHFAATPAQAVEQSMGAVEGGRWLECEIDTARAVGVDGKIKAASCRVLREVDAMGRPVETEGAAS